MSARKFNAKVLLFGEYTILHGSKAIAMPLQHHSGKWIKKHGYRDDNLIKLYEYLVGKNKKNVLHPIDLGRYKEDIDDGLSFESDIPLGYGLGSSGSLCAALFGHYYRHGDSLELGVLKDILAMMESCFHGESSGVDPLVSYLNQPILFHEDKTIELLDSTSGQIDDKLFLVDTQIARSTSQLVDLYKRHREVDKSFKSATDTMANCNNEIILSYLHDDQELFDQQIKVLSQLQLEHMANFLPDYFRNLANVHFDEGRFYLKLCGAGGGGYLMVYTDHIASVRELFSPFKLIALR